MFKILATITPLIKPISIDERYLDITDCKHLGNPIGIAQNLQTRILEELDLPCSIGIAPNKFLAKMASDMQKPAGLTVLRKRDLSHKLWPLSIEEMHGIGEKTAEKLRAIDVTTIGELVQADGYQLKHILGINGERLKNRANGIDARPVDPDAVNEFKSIGNSQTLPHDTTDEVEIRNLLKELSSKVSRRMERREVVGLSIQIMIRYDNRKTITRSQKLQSYISDQDEIFEIAYELFQQHWNDKPIRLLGVTVQDIEEKQNIAQQLNLFTYEREIEKAKLQNVVQELSERFGEHTFKQLSNSEKKTEDFRTSFQKDFLNDYRK